MSSVSPGLTANGLAHSARIAGLALPVSFHPASPRSRFSASTDAGAVPVWAGSTTGGLLPLLVGASGSLQAAPPASASAATALQPPRPRIAGTPGPHPTDA